MPAAVAAPAAPPKARPPAFIVAGDPVDLLSLDDADTDAGTPSTSPDIPMTGILNGMQELRDLVAGMGRLEAALTVMSPAIATTYDIGKLKTAMETRFDAMSKRLEAIEATMQRLQDGWQVVPDEDVAGGTGGAANEWEVDWRWHRQLGWQGCRRRRTPGSDGARGSR